MTGRYQAYPEYKNSGVRFFNYIPQHWAISKVRFISSFGRGLGITKANLKDKGIPCVSYGEVHSKYGFEVDPTKHDLKCVDETYLRTAPDSLLSKGDFVFADTSEDIDGSGNFTQLVSHETLFAGYHTVVVRPTTENYYRFLAYVFDSPEYRTQIRDAVKGVKVFSVTQAILKNTNVWLPTYEEQQKIANFLDHETTKIDTLIAKQEKLIELLKEKRQAVISHAVTHGLPSPNGSNTPMKDSGVEWLGEVPEHWEVKKLKFCANLLSQKETITNQKVIALENIEGYTGKYIISSSIYSGDDVSFNEGDILFGKLRPYLSKVFLCDTSGVAFGDILAFRPNNETSSSFLFYTMISEWFIEIVNSSTYGSKMPRASSDFINEMEIVIPPIDEQIRITEELDTILGKFEILTKKSISAIELMKERKTALISAAITGKIDVRNYNAEKAGS